MHQVAWRAGGVAQTPRAAAPWTLPRSRPRASRLRRCAIRASARRRRGEHEEAQTSFCVQIAQVGVDVETGQVFVYEVLSAHDVAEVLEPISHQSQIEGGVVMGIGYAYGKTWGSRRGE